MKAKLSALCTGLLYLHGRSLISFRSWVDGRTVVRPEVFSQTRNSQHNTGNRTRDLSTCSHWLKQLRHRVCVRERESVCVCGLCLRKCSFINPAYNAPPYCHLRPLAPTYFSTLWQKRHDFMKKLLNIKCVLIFSTTLGLIFVILRRIQQDIVINAETSSCKPPVILVRF